MRGSCALNLACWKSCCCPLSRVQNSPGVRLSPVAVEVGGSLSMSFSRPQAGSLNNRAGLQLVQQVKALLNTLLAPRVSCQVGAGSRFLQQIEKLERNSGSKERESESASQGSLPASSLPRCSSWSGRSEECRLPSLCRRGLRV